jgi:long-chain acyl-CoA synthetase
MSKAETGLAAVVEKYAPGRTFGPDTTIEELGLSSLDRVELMMDLEEKLDTSIDETAFAQVRTVADLAKPMTEREAASFPTYNRSRITKLVRGIALEGILLPLTRIFARCKISGLENLDTIRRPVAFASNHQSYLDTPVILASLPRHWRRRIAPVMWKEYFEAHFHPERHSLRERWANSILYLLVTLLFNAFPIPQTEAGARESIRYMGELVEEGWSILIFPEGGRTTSGEIGPFFPGIGMIAARLHLPVVPVKLRGVGRVLPRDTMRPHLAPVEVAIGPPIHLEGESYPVLARRVEDAVRSL